LKTTILVEKATRELLKELGNKGQTYDELINFLIVKKAPKSRYREANGVNHGE
jgi:hypothetical protein